jgi:hemolysin activation/secretion protein
MPRTPALTALLALCLPLHPLFAKSAPPFERQGQGIHEIVAIVIIGDRKVVHELPVWDRLEADVLSKSISDSDITTIGETLLAWLTADGYVFASVAHRQQGLADGYLAYVVHVGDVGQINVAGNKYYSADQIIKGVGLKSGGKFDYRSLHDDLFALNTKPSVTVDTTIDPKTEDGKNTVDVNLEVTDRLPIHGALTLSNTGSQATGDWRLRTTLQHMNLSKADDVLTAEWLTDPNEGNAVNAFSGSYHRPFGAKNSLTLYGGWSESDINDVLPDLDIFGEGHLVGARINHIIFSDPEHTIDVSAGWTYQHLENATDLAKVAFDESELSLSMPSVTIGFSDKIFDDFDGRNFASLGFVWNSAGNWGSSGSDDFRRQMANADGNINITKFRVARFQRLGKGLTLFGKLDSQYSNSTLVPALQKTIGGADSVRGFREREFGGDSGFTATLELRSPLFSNFIPGLRVSQEELESDPDRCSAHRLQAVGFFDYGMVHRNDPVPGLNEDDDASGIGLGLRFSLSQFSQLKFDYGFPLDETDDSDADGRGHLSLSLQF